MSNLNILTKLYPIFQLRLLCLKDCNESIYHEYILLLVCMYSEIQNILTNGNISPKIQNTTITIKNLYDVVDAFKEDVKNNLISKDGKLNTTNPEHFKNSKILKLPFDFKKYSITYNPIEMQYSIEKYIKEISK